MREPDNASESLRALIATMERLVPGVKGRVGPPSVGELAPQTEGNRAAIEALLRGVSARYPDENVFFWSTRSWGLLEWQATMLAVLGVHGHGIAAPVERVAIGVGGGDAFGHAFPSERGTMMGETESLIKIAGHRLRLRANELLDDLEATVPVKRLLLQRLLADRVLGCLCRLSAERFDTPADRAIALGQAWLSALDLEGASALIPLKLRSGRWQPVLERRSCCLDYRIANGGCCPSCPRLARQDRIKRMRRYWEENVRAL